MTQKRKSSAVVAAAGRAKDATRTPSYHTRNHHGNESPLWDACREAMDADARRKANANARLEAAASRLGFTQDENGQWVRQCPHCRRQAALFTTSDGDVRVGASGSDTRTCPAIPSIQEWLRNEGFQS